MLESAYGVDGRFESILLRYVLSTYDGVRNVCVSFFRVVEADFCDFDRQPLPLS